MSGKYSETITVRLSPEQKRLLEQARERGKCSTRKLLMTAVKLELRRGDPRSEGNTATPFQMSIDEMLDGLMQP